jgi:hypothetical protein
MDNTQTCTPKRALNENVIRAIVRECLDAIEESPEGQELGTTRVELTDPIYKALGAACGTDFENLVARTIKLYGEAMFEYGFEIGRNPNSVFELPTSPYNE